jgi:hypothetical protein
VRGRRGPRSTLRWPIRRIAQPTTGGPNTLLAEEPDRATALDTHQFKEGEVEEAQVFAREDRAARRGQVLLAAQLDAQPQAAEHRA